MLRTGTGHSCGQRGPWPPWPCKISVENSAVQYKILPISFNPALTAAQIGFWPLLRIGPTSVIGCGYDFITPLQNKCIEATKV